MSFKQNSKARQATRSHAVCDGPIRRQHASSVSRGPATRSSICTHQPEGSAHGVLGCASCGADARPVRCPAPAVLLLRAGRVGKERCYHGVSHIEGREASRCGLKRPWHRPRCHREQRAAADYRATTFGVWTIADRWRMAGDSVRSRSSTCSRANAWRSTSGEDSAMGRRRSCAGAPPIRFEGSFPADSLRQPGTEFVSAAMDLGLIRTALRFTLSRRGKLTDNACRSNPSMDGFARECLNVHLVCVDGRCAVEDRRVSMDYNESSPDRAFKGLSS